MSIRCQPMRPKDMAPCGEIVAQHPKKACHSIYERVSAHDPELAPATTPSEDGVGERGKMKKQRLLAYLRDHPEELRPAAPA